MPRKPRGETPILGGSYTARERGLVGVVFYLSRERRQALRDAARAAGQTLADFARDAATRAAEEILKKD
jgi:uncharacterized protein (DUF1778 family)